MLARQFCGKSPISIAYRIAGAYYRGKRPDKSEITPVYTCSLYLHVCAGWLW